LALSAFKGEDLVSETGQRIISTGACPRHLVVDSVSLLDFNSSASCVHSNLAKRAYSFIQCTLYNIIVLHCCTPHSQALQPTTSLFSLHKPQRHNKTFVIMRYQTIRFTGLYKEAKDEQKKPEFTNLQSSAESLRSVQSQSSVGMQSQTSGQSRWALLNPRSSATRSG
jgi:hypothetical protein